ncbi:hypothetical protein [Thauera propionica]|uniref:hypothetical protein n=1 Tax=Thauera propionica TaxID=2019431 RepID=UPI0023F4CA9E|nr:hypothetical protein [Thauera propionica]MDD3675685.1 hypothetical protein [Thauera propionica]
MNAKLPSVSSAASEADDSVTFALRELSAHLSAVCTAGDRDPAAALEGILRAEDELRAYVAGGWRVGDMQGVRLAARGLADAYWSLFVQAGHAVSRVSVAASCAEALKWDALEAVAPDPILWERLGSLLRPDLDAGLALIAGDLESVARHYLRGVSYQAAAFDQIDRSLLVPACQLLDMCLPFLAMSRRAPAVPHYLAFPELGAVPRRSLVAPRETAFHLSTAAAEEWLQGLASRLAEGLCPAVLDRGEPDDYLAVVRHLLCRWADEPPVRRSKRHPMGGQVLVVRGVEACRRLIAGDVDVSASRWSVFDANRLSMGIVGEGHSVPAIPSIGELVGVRFEDADLVHLGLVRRLRVDPGGVRCGLQLVSRAARTAMVEDGRVPAQVLLCDPLARGEAARLIAPSASVLRDDSLFLRAASAVYKLHPLETPWLGPGFAMRVYQLI